jgi:hypothetical protein
MRWTGKLPELDNKKIAEEISETLKTFGATLSVYISEKFGYITMSTIQEASDVANIKDLPIFNNSFSFSKPFFRIPLSPFEAIASGLPPYAFKGSSPAEKSSALKEGLSIPGSPSFTITDHSPSLGHAYLSFDSQQDLLSFIAAANLHPIYAGKKQIQIQTTRSFNSAKKKNPSSLSLPKPSNPDFSSNQLTSVITALGSSLQQRLDNSFRQQQNDVNALLQKKEDEWRAFQSKIERQRAADRREDRRTLAALFSFSQQQATTTALLNQINMQILAYQLRDAPIPEDVTNRRDKLEAELHNLQQQQACAFLFSETPTSNTPTSPSPRKPKKPNPSETTTGDHAAKSKRPRQNGFDP